jgi:hypothetical protein
MGLLAAPGERVRRHQPLAWIGPSDEPDETASWAI